MSAAQHPRDDERPDVPRTSAAKVRERIAQVRRGEVIPHAEVDRWLAPWGTPDELPASTLPERSAPTCRWPASRPAPSRASKLSEPTSSRMAATRSPPHARPSASAAPADLSTSLSRRGRLGAVPGTFEKVAEPYVITHEVQGEDVTILAVEHGARRA